MTNFRQYQPCCGLSRTPSTYFSVPLAGQGSSQASQQSRLAAAWAAAAQAQAAAAWAAAAAQAQAPAAWAAAAEAQAQAAAQAQAPAAWAAAAAQAQAQARQGLRAHEPRLEGSLQGWEEQKCPSEISAWKAQRRLAQKVGPFKQTGQAGAPFVSLKPCGLPSADACRA